MMGLGFVQSVGGRRGYHGGRVCATMRVAVIGGGLAGVSVCDRLLRGGVEEVVMFDVNKIAEGNASAAAAGLMHKFTPRAKKAFMADDAFARSAEVITGTAPEAIVRRGPIVRLVRTKQHEKDYNNAAKLIPEELKLLQPSELLQYVPNVEPTLALLIRDAFVIDVKLYLKLLWKRCAEDGRASWRQREITDLDGLFREGFDSIVIAAGHRSPQLVPNLPLDPKKGRNVIFDRDSSATDLLPLPLMAGKYVVPLRSGKILTGASTEPDSSSVPFSASPTIQDTLLTLGDRIYDIYPPLRRHYHPTQVTTGVRAIPIRPPGTSPIPYVTQLRPNVWILTGLASRGLLHHALLADFLAHAILTNNSNHIPNPFHPSTFT